VTALGIEGRVAVLRGRAEEQRLGVDVVTARAVAPLDRLAGWTLPLVREGGVLLALKGEGAAAEVESSQAALEKVGGGHAEVLLCGAGVVEPLTTVVRVVRLTSGRRRSGR
jgi:16S rRNA (guanine527-N7)-methyltransferase